MRAMTATVFSSDGSSEPFPYTISVPKFGNLKDFIQALSIACSLRDDESLLVAEVCLLSYAKSTLICPTCIRCMCKSVSLIFCLKDVVVQVYNNRIIRYLEEPSDAISLIRDGDRLVAYRLPKDNERASIVVFMHQRKEE